MNKLRYILYEVHQVLGTMVSQNLFWEVDSCKMVMTTGSATTSGYHVVKIIHGNNTLILLFGPRKTTMSTTIHFTLEHKLYAGPRGHSLALMTRMHKLV